MQDNDVIDARRAQRFGRYGAALGLLLGACPCALALNPALDVSQYGHASWRYRDGFTKGEIQSLAQTPDGYLWLGTTFGLVRFDGVRPAPWQPPPDQPLPSTNINRLLAARDGTLWIGTRNGLASWKNGKLTRYAELAGSQVFALLEDRDGSIWVGGYAIPTGKFCEIRNGSVRCHPELGGLGSGVFGLHEDGKGNLWVGLLNALWRWKPGTPEFYALPGITAGVQGIADDENGKLLISSYRGEARRFVDGKFQTAYTYPPPMRGLHASLCLRDRSGGLWLATHGAGIFHVHQGRADVFSHLDGLTGDSVNDLFEDREGNMWVATAGGVDRFCDLPVVTYSTGQGLSGSLAGSVLAAKDGSIWIATDGGLNRLNHGQFSVYRQGGDSIKPAVGWISVPGLSTPESLFEDSRGRIWVATSTGAGYLEDDRLISTAAPGGPTYAITEDNAGNIWIVNQKVGLIALSAANEHSQIPWSTFGRAVPGTAVAADPRNGGIWLGFGEGGIVWFRDGQVRASFSAGEGLAAGRVRQIRFDREGALWVAADGGLSRLKDGRIATLTSGNGLPCDGVQWALEDDAGSFWLDMPCGLARVSRAELEAWGSAKDQAPLPRGRGSETNSRGSESGGRGAEASGRGAETAGSGKPVMIHPTVFDASDGVMPIAQPGTYSPRVAKSADGKLWFVENDGISVVDPLHIAGNKLPPPVQIEQIIADRKTYVAGTKWRLPSLTRDVEIDYTGLSFVAPEKVRFKYKLEGRDPDWVDVGNRRQAFYNDLPPRNYRFRVMASNNDGVWNEAGASLGFSVDPAYYQTTWFWSLVAAAVLGLLAALYQLRLRYLKHQFDTRLDARVGERTRIARELHDTLLQSFQGTLLKFHALSYMLQDHPQAKKTLEDCMGQAQAAVSEGREAVQDMRSSTVVANDLARAITAFGRGFAADQDEQDGPEFRVQVEGKSRDLPPLVRDEAYRIACEALRNAFRHAQAKRIEVEIRYAPRHFRLCVADNGKGIDPVVLSAGGRAGHHGLPGIHERAELAGGKLAVRSKLNSGTEIELIIPASIAYLKSSPPPASSSTTAGEGNG